MDNILDTLKFSKEFIFHPFTVSSVIPSSKSLSSAIVSISNIQNAKTIFEFGCGTGIITNEIVKNAKNALIFSFDINPNFTKLVKQKYPKVEIINDSVENAKKYMKIFNISNVDSIISSLPWAAFNDALQISLLDEIYEILNSNGVFLTYTYIHTKLFPSHRKFIKKLHKKTWEVEFSDVIWFNVPPAFIIKCKKG